MLCLENKRVMGHLLWMGLVMLLMHTVAAEQLTITNTKAITPKGDYIAASFSPDGKHIVASRAKFNELYEIGEGKTPELLLSGELVGFGCEWLPDSSGVVTRSLISGRVTFGTVSLQKSHSVLSGEFDEQQLPVCFRNTLFILTSKGVPHLISGTLPLEALRFPSLIKDMIYFNKGPQLERISPEGDVYYLPKLSPCERSVVFEGIETGIWIFETATKHLVNIGRGNHPAWSPDGNYLFFDISEDNGKEIVASELWRVKSDGSEKQQLTNTNTIIELRPRISPDAKQIIYDADGQIWLGDLEVQ